MKVSLKAFTGLRPAVAADLLRPGEATEAVNTNFTGGGLTPYAGLSSAVVTLTSANAVQTIYRYSQNNTNEAQHWFQSENDVNFVKGPVDGDTEERTYFTGHLSYPAKTKSDIATTSTPYPTTTQPMGVAKPASAPSGSVTGTPDVGSTAESLVYVMTLVTSWGEEGPPSAVSATLTRSPGQTVSFTGLATTGVASYPGNSNKSQTFTSKRLYRSATGSSGIARFLLVTTEGDIPIATTTYSDTKNTSQLGEELSTRYYLEPPDGMKGLVEMANGIMAGYVDNTVCFSEPYVPYAWPVRYQLSVDGPVVGIAAFGQSLLVSTRRSLYVMTGTDPGQMTTEKLAVAQACVSKRSMVPMMGGVVFACPDGLGFVDARGFKLLSDGLLTRKQWQAYKPESMHAYETEGSYLVFYDTGAAQKGLLFKLDSEPSFCETDVYATAGFRDKGRDALYLCTNAGGTSRDVKKWDAGSNLTMTWTSGELKLPAPTNMSVARIDATGNVTFTLIADGVTKFGPTTVSSIAAFKLPADYRATRYKLKVSGINTVRSIELADSMKALVYEN